MHTAFVQCGNGSQGDTTILTGIIPVPVFCTWYSLSVSGDFVLMRTLVIGSGLMLTYYGLILTS